MAEDRADGLDVARLPRVHHPVESLLGAIDVRQSRAEVGASRTELRYDLAIDRFVLDVGQAGDLESGLLQDGDQLFALAPSHGVGRFFQAGAVGACVEHHDPEIRGAGAHRHVLDRAVGRIVVCAHAFPGEQDHRLVELAAGRADVVVLDRLSQIDDLNVLLDLDLVRIEQRENQIDAQRRRAAHAAARDVTVKNRVDPLGELEPLTPQDVVDAVGKSAPRLGDGR